MPPNENDANPNNLRIVSLIPSATDICVHLGLGDHVVGITHCCDREGLNESVVVVTEDQIHASVTSQGEIHDKVVANGKKAQAVLEGEAELCSLTTDEIPTLYPINKKLLKQIQPTLIVTQDLCHVCAPSSQTVLMALKEAGIENATIILLTPMNLWDVVANLQQVADASGISTRGKILCDELSTNLHTLKSIIRNHKQRKRGNKQPKKLLVMEWVDPPFCGGHWIREYYLLFANYVRKSNQEKCLSCQNFETCYLSLTHKNKLSLSLSSFVKYPTQPTWPSSLTQNWPSSLPPRDVPDKSLGRRFTIPNPM